MVVLRLILGQTGTIMNIDRSDVWLHRLITQVVKVKLICKCDDAQQYSCTIMSSFLHLVGIIMKRKTYPRTTIYNIQNIYVNI